MTIEVLTRNDDTLDEVCYRTYGRTDMIEQVISLNCHAIYADTLPAGVRLTMPVLPKTKPKEPQIKLWE